MRYRKGYVWISAYSYLKKTKGRKRRIRIHVKGGWRKLPSKTKKLWRLTLAYNYVYHGNYYSLVLQAWSKDKKGLKKMENFLARKLNNAFIEITGYDADEMELELNSTFQHGSYPAHLNNTWKIRNELVRKGKKARKTTLPEFTKRHKL